MKKLHSTMVDPVELYSIHLLRSLNALNYNLILMGI